MKTETHNIQCVDGQHEVKLDIFVMDGVEAVEAYDLPRHRYSSGGFRIEAMVNGTPAGIFFYTGDLGSTYCGGDSSDAARAILAEARRNGVLPAVALQPDKEMTELQARVLHSDGTVMPVTINVAAGLAPGADLNTELVLACTKLRNADPSVAAVRVAVPGFEKPYRWMGNYTAEHMDAVTAREKNGTDNW